VLLLGLLVSRILPLKKTDVVDREGITMLVIDDHELHLPPRVAALVRQQRDFSQQLLRLNRLAATPNPWLFPGRNATRPLGRGTDGARYRGASR
jgi:hypothetical protein